MSAVLEAEGNLLAPRAPRPATPVRLLLFALALTGCAVVLGVGFPRGAPDRLPVLLIALALALDAVVRPTAAIRDFCFAFPVAGFLAGLSGATDPVAWPVLLFGGLAAGWTFRFLYDFESVPTPRVPRASQSAARFIRSGLAVLMIRDVRPSPNTMGSCLVALPDSL